MKRKTNKLKKKIIATVSSVFLIGMGVATGTVINQKVEESKTVENQYNLSNKKDIVEDNDNRLYIHYIDVGQGDAILIHQHGYNMLIDAGGNEKGAIVQKYLEEHNIKELSYVVDTHPHEDHIGGLDYIINSFKIGNVFMPKKIAITKTYQDVITALKIRIRN